MAAKNGTSHERVDPAGLLLGVTAMAVGTLLGGGSWTIEDSAVALVVGLILHAFYGMPSGMAPWRETIAVSAVYWLVLTVALAYPIQLRHSECREFRPASACTDQHADDTTVWSALGALLPVAAYAGARRRSPP